MWWLHYLTPVLQSSVTSSQDRKRPKTIRFQFSSLGVIKISFSNAFVFPLLSSSCFAVQRLSDTVLKDIDFLFSLVVIQGHFLNEDYSSSVWSHERWALSLVHWAFEVLRISEGPEPFPLEAFCLVFHQRNIWACIKQHAFNWTNKIP